MKLLDVGTALTCYKTIYFLSSQRTISPVNATVTVQNSTCVSFGINIQLNLNEHVVFSTTWEATATTEGDYSIALLVVSDDSDIDPEFAACQNVQGVKIVSDVPVMREPEMSPVYRQPDINPQDMYIYPDQAVEVRCNITSPIGISNCYLYYSIDSGENWNREDMARTSVDEYYAIVPGQSEGRQVVLYLEAVSTTERSSRTRQYIFTVSNLQTLDLMTKTIGSAALLTIVIGCGLIFVRRRRKMHELPESPFDPSQSRSQTTVAGSVAKTLQAPTQNARGGKQ